MTEYDLHQLLNNAQKLESVIKSLQEKNILNQQVPDPSEIKGHILKATLFMNKIEKSIENIKRY